MLWIVGRVRGELNAGELVEIGAQNVPFEEEVGVLAAPLDADEARGGELLEVMGEGRGGDGRAFVQAAAGGGALAAAEGDKDLVAARGGERAGDERELLPGELDGFGGGPLFWHVFGLRYSTPAKCCGGR